LRVIPVLDLRAGRAVLASGGRRASYAPVRSVLAAAEAGAGDAVALARASATASPAPASAAASTDRTGA